MMNWAITYKSACDHNMSLLQILIKVNRRALENSEADCLIMLVMHSGRSEMMVSLLVLGVEQVLDVCKVFYDSHPLVIALEMWPAACLF